MENILVYDKDNDERCDLTERIRDDTAYLSDAQLKLWEYGLYEKACDFVMRDPVLQLAVMEIAGKNDIALTQLLRQKKEQLDMMLVADASISPMEYMTPDIRACSLLLRPYRQEELESVVRSFMAAYFRRMQTGDAGSSLIIENRQGITAIPFHSIYYVEARAKRVYIRQQDREYSKYDSLENVRAILPDYFIQSHRSYIFNTRYLERVRLSENMICLEHGITVPLARSFKSSVKEFLNGK